MEEQNEEIKQEEFIPITETFEVQRVNDKGNKETLVFKYDYKLMNGRHRFFAKNACLQWEKSFNFSPDTPPDVKKFADRDLYNLALGSLVRRIPNGYKDEEPLKPFIPDKPEGLELLDLLYGDDINRLESCYENFRDRMGIPSFELILLSNDLNKLVEASPILQTQITETVAEGIGNYTQELMQNFTKTMQPLIASVMNAEVKSSG